MQHGIHAYFVERTRCRERVSTLSVGIGCGLLALLWVPTLPPIARLLHRTEFARFGFAGPERVVPIVHLDTTVEGEPEPLLNVGQVRSVAATRGGGGKPLPTAAPRGPRSSARGAPLHGLGEDDHDLVARALASQGRIPIMQSEELIIERLVRPSYPELAHAQGIEGKVAVLALVDTAGLVVDAEVMTGSGELTLDRSAVDAVRQCVFRPYRVQGEVREVYALFRFAFRIY